MALLEPQARQCGVRLHCQLASDLPLLESDTASLQQVFFNLVKNGIEAIVGEGEVSIAARRVGPHVEVTVTDTGTGIPPEWERKIFDPFFTTKPPGQGTGLGLPISCLLIEGLGGTLRFTSHVGRGTTFTVLLPAPQNGVGV
ncbi:MAG TPA: ATP-binding protein [Methylomirabilota bacterium]|nr:ATP-binding protein [Methylomirabilota bacterium]